MKKSINKQNKIIEIKRAIFSRKGSAMLEYGRTGTFQHKENDKFFRFHPDGMMINLLFHINEKSFFYFPSL